MEVNYEAIEAVSVYGGGYCRPLWEQKKNESTYYSYTLDKQGSIPGRSVEELERELGLA